MTDLLSVTIKRKKKVRRQRKAPGAPKRGKSPYILFSMHVREDVKQTLPSDAKVTDVVKAIAKLWREQSDEQRKPWDEAARLDKERYEAEMAIYDGPLRIPTRHQAGRKATWGGETPPATTAFMYFSIDMKAQWKMNEPYLNDMEIASRLVHVWSEMSTEQKRPYFDHERADQQQQQQQQQQQRYCEQVGEWGPGVPGAGVAAGDFVPSSSSSSSSSSMSSLSEIEINNDGGGHHHHHHHSRPLFPPPPLTTNNHVVHHPMRHHPYGVPVVTPDRWHPMKLDYAALLPDPTTGPAAAAAAAAPAYYATTTNPLAFPSFYNLDYSGNHHHHHTYNHHPYVVGAPKTPPPPPPPFFT